MNADLAHFEQIRRFQILQRDFSPEENEITPTLKLKRRVVEENSASEPGTALRGIAISTAGLAADQ